MLDRIPIASVYRKEVEAIPERAPVAEVLRTVGTSRSSTFPVLGEGGVLVGVLSFAGLRTVLLEGGVGAVVAADLCDPHVPTLTPEASLGAAFRLMEREGLEDVPVTDPADARRLLGMLSRADVIGAYNRAVASLGALPMSSWLSSAEVGRSEEFRVAVLGVPRAWIGRTLRAIDCRARYGVTVLAVHPAGDATRAYQVPDPDRALAPDDRLVLAGTAEGLRRAGAE
jgi:CBS domain-containing protein